MNVEEYREVLHEDIALAANANMSNVADEFLAYVTDILISGEEFDDFTECYYEGISRRKANMRIDGYAMDDADGSCCVFISDYRGPYESDTINKDVIENCFKRIRYFVNESIKYELYQELEESTQVYEFSRMLHYDIESISKFRFYLLTDAYNNQRTKNIKDDEVGGKTVELNVWDVTRIFDVVSSKTQKESVEIMLPDMGYSGIPCVKAVEYKDVIADIEVLPKYDDDIVADEKEEKPENVITYTSYLAVVPGKILNELYLEYGSRLLEGNVRSFLSVRGKVNKSIQNTIKNYPEMFFAYNNGIAATASEIDTEMTPEGLKITRIKDLQIVNGGQTTASIANTLLTAKKDENIDIERLYVPMKVSVLEHTMSEKIIPKISEYSNSQNKVDASDFFSNHPFHIRMEDYSRKTPAPAVNGNQFQQYWYYERTRGQYNQGKMKFKPKSSQMKQYETRYPESQVIKLVDLAKYMEIYEGAPDKVSKGKQAIVKVFAENIRSRWAKSDAEFNNFYYKRVCALAIIYKGSDDIVKQTDWYKEKHSYKANVIVYTMSIVFDYIRKNVKGYELDFMRVWNLQGLYPELAEQIKVLCTEVYEYITDDGRPIENVTEWCKRDLCWQQAQKQKWTINDSFLRTLISQESLKAEEKEAKEERKVANEVDDLKFIMASGKEYWQKVMDWGVTRRLLSDMELSIIKMVINMEITGRIPSSKQAKVVIKARERLIVDGMPLQF
ncbi:MAG: AIPR family protein [Lachnospiraceae bacterium]|nr:AIPR family protein [Lachnospiraceae bacterium]